MVIAGARKIWLSCVELGQRVELKQRVEHEKIVGSNYVLKLRLSVLKITALARSSASSWLNNQAAPAPAT